MLRSKKYEKDKKKLRESSLDIVRGMAVFLMILAHTVAFFHSGGNKTLTFLQNIGDTVCFTLFLYVSGATSYYAYISSTKSDWKTKKYNLLKRLVLLLFGYYFVAIVSSLHNFKLPPDSSWLNHIAGIILLIKVPGYTEFLIPFLFFGALGLIFKRELRGLSKNLIAIIALSALAYATGTLLYHVDVPSGLTALKSLVVGDKDLYRFPILQYTPVFLLGIASGQILKNTRSHKKKLKFFALSSIPFLFFILISVFVGQIAKFPYTNDFQRWPPAISFLSWGLGLSFSLSYILLKMHVKERQGLIARILSYLGAHAFGLYIIHLVILQIQEVSLHYKTNSIPVTIGLFCIVFTITLVINNRKLPQGKKAKTKSTKSAIRYSARPTKVKRAKLPEFGYKHRNNYLATLILIMIFSALGIFFVVRTVLNSNPLGSSVDITAEQNTTDPQVLGTLATTYTWWNSDYSYFRQITVTNNSQDSINKDDWVKVQVNHQDMIDTQKSNSDGSDIRIVYLSDEGTYSELVTSIDNLAATNTSISFKLAKDIGPGATSNNYFLYYGNTIAQGTAQNDPVVIDISGYETSISDETRPLLFGQTSRTWYLKGNSLPTEYTQLSYTVAVHDTIGSVETLNYTILDTAITGTLERYGTEEHTANIDISSLDPGDYQIQAYFKKDETTYYSQKSTFFLSYPMYVAMTLDWEGGDVEDSDLALVQKLSDEHYGLSYTHMFNPRIYLPSVLNQDRATYLTDWVKEREAEGDYIGLHLHMYFDLVEAAGVPVRKEPQWTNYLDTGHDVPCSEYTTQEFSQILLWSKKQFGEHGLSAPLVFRAGGWYVNQNTLQALENTGFLIESSGRDYYIWGQNQIKGYWTLLPTTQPYQPSKQNQNSSNPAPRYNLYEFPDNGANSRFYTAAQMIDRFKVNYTTSLLTTPKVITYLSHPQGFYLDYEILEKIFEYTDQFAAAADTGPVVYVNQMDIYNDLYAD